MAFGTGHHETTRSCLVLMENYAPKRTSSTLAPVWESSPLPLRKLGFRHLVGIDTGILVGQESEVIGAMEQAGLRLRETYHDGKWVSLVMERGGKA